MYIYSFRVFFTQMKDLFCLLFRCSVRCVDIYTE